jgi:hypothetical protein
MPSSDHDIPDIYQLELQESTTVPGSLKYFSTKVIFVFIIIKSKLVLPPKIPENTDKQEQNQEEVDNRSPLLSRLAIYLRQFQLSC